MSPDIEQKLRTAYPNGSIHDLFEEALINPARDERLRDVLNFITAQCPIRVASQLSNNLTWEYTLTQIEHPPFETWVWRMDNPAKLKWIAQSRGEHYPVFWLKFSRVADFYYCFFNLWHPRGETGYLDGRWTDDPPTAAWASYLRLIKSTLQEYDFEMLPEDVARSEVPFILEPNYDAVPEDDPSWENAEFEPPVEPSSVHRCLFGI
jgi:hypothetical protein